MPQLAADLIDFYALTGGLNCMSSGVRLSHSEAHDLQDCDLYPIGGISKRAGYAKLNTSAVSTNACTGLYMARYSTAGGTNIALMTNGTRLYSMSSLNGTWNDSTNAQTITYTANNIWFFEMLNDITIATNGVDPILQISSTPTATALGGLPFTICKFVLEYRGYMLYFVPTVGGNVQYDRFYFSSIDDPTTVSATNLMDIYKKHGGDIRGAVDYKGYLYVFKRNTICQVIYQVNRVNSSGALFPFIEFPNPIIPDVGTQSHRSICKFTTPATHATPGQELVFFVDQFGVPRIFDGITTMSFASKIFKARDANVTSLSNMDFTRLPYCFSVNYPAQNKILCFMSKTNSQQDTVWVLDYSTGFSFSRYKYASAFNVGALFEKTDGTWKPYVGDYAGMVHQLDQGTNDNGSPISWYYITGDSWNKNVDLRNDWDFVELRGTTGNTGQTVTIQAYADGTDSPGLSDTKILFDTQTTWGTTGAGGTMTWGVSSWAKTGVVARTQELHLQGKQMRLKFSDATLDTTVILEGFSLAARTLGTSQS